MKIKKFYAKSMQAALAEIKKEFGDNAIILGQKKVTLHDHPSLKEALEVTAAADKADNEKPEASPFHNLLRENISKKPKSSPISNVELGLIRKDLDYLNNRIEMLVNHIKYENLPHIPKILQGKVRKLIENGVAPEFANKIIEEILLHMKGEELLEEDKIDDKILHKIKNKLMITGPLSIKGNRTSVVVLVGPTGAGKTTTLAKLSARYKYTHGKNVAVVSADSFRMGAMEQLKSFADIASIDFFPVYQNKDMPEILKKTENYDMVFLDTPGINPKNIKKMSSLKELIRISGSDEVHLVLSMTTRYNDLCDAIKNYSILHYKGIIFSKLDEAGEFGDIVNLANDFQKPVSYLTFGQNIPEDIKIADRKEIANTIIRGKYGIL